MKEYTLSGTGNSTVDRSFSQNNANDTLDANVKYNEIQLRKHKRGKTGKTDQNIPVSILIQLGKIFNSAISVNNKEQALRKTNTSEDYELSDTMKSQSKLMTHNIKQKRSINDTYVNAHVLADDETVFVSFVQNNDQDSDMYLVKSGIEAKLVDTAKEFGLKAIKFSINNVFSKTENIVLDKDKVNELIKMISSYDVFRSFAEPIIEILNTSGIAVDRLKPIKDMTREEYAEYIKDFHDNEYSSNDIRKFFIDYMIFSYMMNIMSEKLDNKAGAMNLASILFKLEHRFWADIRRESTLMVKDGPSYIQRLSDEIKDVCMNNHDIKTIKIIVQQDYDELAYEALKVLIKDHPNMKFIFSAHNCSLHTLNKVALLDNVTVISTHNLDNLINSHDYNTTLTHSVTTRLIQDRIVSPTLYSTMYDTIMESKSQQSILTEENHLEQNLLFERPVSKKSSNLINNIMKLDVDVDVVIDSTTIGKMATVKADFAELVENEVFTMNKLIDSKKAVVYKKKHEHFDSIAAMF